eukprot:TRINITY_DN1873_c0_g1_i1.p1 TRINITY_DN1873_c0_g1~~TRINITY_DN1873_c0_g1_i1.p1  ORF type:complete len:164 (+),score=25.65 TRINITY_DN1873_c0_g1_i1:101-592(+)
MLTGRATSNVFDGTKRVGGENESGMLLCGIERRSTVGFMASHREIQVGDNYRMSELPIWVIFADSHYSVLFALSKEVTRYGVDASSLIGSPQFDVFYYDMLANQNEQIRLTITVKEENPVKLVGKQKPKKSIYTEELESYVDRCIRTRWAWAAINWNGVDPLL